MRTSARAAVADNPREDNMLACTVQLRNGNECSLLTLPMIGMEFADPDVEDIMSRVLVSHDWMGERFRQVLQTMPREILLLTRALRERDLAPHSSVLLHGTNSRDLS